MKKQLDLHSFMEKFRTEEQCLKFLVKQKWGNGYRCWKCNCDQYYKGRTWSFRRCKACGYDESATANTLFHKLKFPLPTAFVIIYQLSTMKIGMSTIEIGRQHGIHQETAWYFKKKVQLAMAKLDEPLLSGAIEVDEAVIGGFEPGVIGRAKGRRKNIQVAVELGATSPVSIRQQMLRAKARLITDFSAGTLQQSIDEMIKKKALLITDKWTAYIKAKGSRTHLSILSQKGDGMPEIHRLIFNLKNWIRGIHHKVSEFHLQAYLDEFFCRFNNRNLLSSLPKRITEIMLQHPWAPYKSIIAC